jgi:hypothetical protein
LSGAIQRRGKMLARGDDPTRYLGIKMIGISHRNSADAMSKTNFCIHLVFWRHLEEKPFFFRFSSFNECKRIKHNT